MSARTVLERVLLVGVLWLLGGGIGLVAGAAFVVYDLVSRPTPRDLLVIAVLLLGLVPLVVLARGLPAADAVGPAVEGNLVAHYLAGGGLALLVVGVLREVRPGRPGHDEAPAPLPVPPAGGAAVTPLVSVVVPTRNAGRTIETCLRSIRAQTWPALELIVVDNGSTDATWAVAERHADLALRGGPERSAQRNLGIAHAAGEWVCYVDADMELGPDVVERAVRAGEHRPARSGWPSPRSRSGRGSGPAAGPWSGAACATSPSLLWPRLVRTGYLRDTGGFAPWLTGTEDAELHRRMVAHGVPDRPGRAG